MLLLHGHLSARRMHDRCRRRRWSPRNFLINLEPWRLHWIFLHFHHPNKSLFSARVESHSLLRRCVLDVLSRGQLISGSDRHGCSDLLQYGFFQGYPCFFCYLFNGFFIRSLQVWVICIHDFLGNQVSVLAINDLVF